MEEMPVCAGYVLEDSGVQGVEAGSGGQWGTGIETDFEEQ